MRSNSMPGYEYLDGTSMATPEVSGAAALVLTKDPTLAPWQVRAMLMAGADQVPGLHGKVASGGRLDVYGAMSATAPAAGAQAVAAAEGPAPRTVTPTTPTTPSTPATPTPPHATPTLQPAADRTAPAVTPALAGRHTLATLLAGRLRASVTTSERAIVRFDLRVDGRTAKRLHLSKTAAAVQIGTGSATVTKAGKKAATLRLTSAAKRALARVRNVKVALRATATDAAGNARTRSVAVTVTR
jgi:hypothetical protein